MADGVAEVQDAAQPDSRSSADTTSALIRHDAATSGATASPSRAKIAGSESRDPIEQRRIGDHAVLDHLVQAGAEFAARQRVEHRRIGDDQAAARETRRSGSCRADG